MDRHVSFVYGDSMLLRLVFCLCVALLGSSPAAAHGTHQARLSDAERRIATAPDNPDLYRDRSVLYREHGDYRAALADLERADALDPGRPLTDLLRGRVELARGNPREAAAALERCLAAWPEHPEVHLALARARAAQGRSSEAVHHYDRALATAPVQSPDHHLERARALAAAGRHEEALAGLDAAMQSLGPHPALVDAAIEFELEGGHTEAALARLEAGRARRLAGSLLRRGEILEGVGRFAEAERAYRDALADLSSRRRNTPARRELEDRTRAALARLEG